MNWHHRLRRLLVTGMSGSGKSTLTIRLIERHGAKWLFIFDPEREFSIKEVVAAHLAIYRELLDAA